MIEFVILVLVMLKGIFIYLKDARRFETDWYLDIIYGSSYVDHRLVLNEEMQPHSTMLSLPCFSG